MQKGWKIAWSLAVGAVCLNGCANNDISSNPAYKLSFSTNAVSFDTVFSTIGSSTNSFLIYNRNSKPVSIGSISLANGASSGFHIIVDGAIPAGNTLSNVEIRARDSLYVFVSVTVNPTLQNNPVLIKDSVVFMTNGNRQSVQLSAYGQDVVIFRGKTIRNDTILTAAKPYLIYDYLAVDNNKTLTIQPGATFYFHKQASLKIYGNLKAEGTENARIVFRGDRTDKLFDDVPYSYLSGQWDGIQLRTAQCSASFNYVTMISGRSAIRIPDGTPDRMPFVNINNTRIHNFDSCGIVARNVNMAIYNSEISNCKISCLSMTGGNYSLIQNTIANYYNDIYSGERRDGTPSVTLSNGESDKHALNPAPLNVQFINCAVAGSMPNEIMITDTTRNTPLKFLFDHCYILSAPIHSPLVKNVQWGNSKDPLFIRTSINNGGYYDFNPSEQSVLRKKADIQISQQPDFRFDMNGIPRLQDNTPDIGAYQWTKK